MHHMAIPRGQISKSVGIGQLNQTNDVIIVQEHLIRHAKWLLPLLPPVKSGKCDEATITATKKFQEVAISFMKPDGVVGVCGTTIRFLAKPVIIGPQNKVFLPVCWGPQDTALTKTELTDAASQLRCDVAAIQAVAQVETKRAAWDSLGRPSILFERKLFADYTHRAYNATSPDISGPHGHGEYGLFDAQYPKLYRAAMLDETAALRAASWGTFQILGNNFAACNFQSVDAFVLSMMRSVNAHLVAFVAFILSDKNRLAALQNHDWASFALHYNGRDYTKYHYETNLAAAYRAITVALAPKVNQAASKANAGAAKK